jgi:hypothetical protein
MWQPGTVCKPRGGDGEEIEMKISSLIILGLVLIIVPTVLMFVSFGWVGAALTFAFLIVCCGIGWVSAL